MVNLCLAKLPSAPTATTLSDERTGPTRGGLYAGISTQFHVESMILLTSARLLARGLGGYLADLYELATFQFTNPRSFSKYLAIKRVARKTGARVFIEGG